MLTEDALIYVTGYVVFRFKRKYPDLGNPTKHCTYNNLPPWIFTMSRGKLIYPSDDMIAVSKIVEEEFQKFHLEFLSSDSFIFDKLTNIIMVRLEKGEALLKSNIPRAVIACFVRTRTYFRLKKINEQRQLAKYEKKLKRIEKNKKFTNVNKVNTNSNEMHNFKNTAPKIPITNMDCSSMDM